MIESRLAHKTIALAILLIVLLGFARVGYIYVAYYQSRAAQILEQRKALGRLFALLEQADEVDRIAAAHEFKEATTLLFKAATTSLLMAQLQQQLQAIVTVNQAQFVRASELPVGQQQGFTFIGLRLDITGTIENLTRTVKAMETSVPALNIQKATITADPITQTAPDRMPQLAMSLEITAVSRIDESLTAAELK
jgi:Type II secretion system (T2SS), protein M subtype b